MKFAELYEMYWRKHVVVRLKNTDNVRYFWNCQGDKWKDREVDSLQTSELQDWFDDMAVVSKSAAVKYINLLSAMISWGVKRGYLDCKNPCKDVDKLRLRPRGRFLQPDEFERLKKALALRSQDVQDIVWLLLYTGARRGNVLAMEWEEINTDLQMWTIPAWKHKNADSHISVLTAPALAILERRKKTAQSRFVFPGRFRLDAPRVDVKRQWCILIKQAEIKDFRIHDLRRTFGSYMAINGSSLPIIAQALGHTDHRSTAIYARLNMEPVRIAVESSQARFLAT